METILWIKITMENLIMRLTFRWQAIFYTLIVSKSAIWFWGCCVLSGTLLFTQTSHCVLRAFGRNFEKFLRRFFWFGSFWAFFLLSSTQNGSGWVSMRANHDEQLFIHTWLLAVHVSMPEHKVFTRVLMELQGDYHGLCKSLISPWTSNQFQSNPKLEI